MLARDGSLGVGIVGAGWMGQVHAASWVANAPRGTIAAIADVSEPRARALAMAHTGGDARIYGDLDRLLADPGVDAIDICLPHHLHVDAITKAARAGKHIFCEKPLCLSFDEARAIKAAVESTGVILVCAHNNLFQLPLVEARRLIGEGVLGRVYSIESFEIGRNTGLINRRTQFGSIGRRTASVGGLTRLAWAAPSSLIPAGTAPIACWLWRKPRIRSRCATGRGRGDAE